MNTKKAFIRLLVSDKVIGDKVPIFCNQENFLLKENTYKVYQTLPGFQIIPNPALLKNQTKGRPCNGMFIAYPDFLKNQVTNVSPGNWPIQAGCTALLN